jgi:hypothetical protein
MKEDRLALMKAVDGGDTDLGMIFTCLAGYDGHSVIP